MFAWEPNKNCWFYRCLSFSHRMKLSGATLAAPEWLVKVMRTEPTCGNGVAPLSTRAVRRLQNMYSNVMWCCAAMCCDVMWCVVVGWDVLYCDVMQFTVMCVVESMCMSHACSCVCVCSCRKKNREYTYLTWHQMNFIVYMCCEHVRHVYIVRVSVYIQDSRLGQLYLFSLFIGILTAPSPAHCSMPWRVMSDLQIIEVRMECYPNIVSTSPRSKATMWHRMVLRSVPDSRFCCPALKLSGKKNQGTGSQNSTRLPFCWATCHGEPACYQGQRMYMAALPPASAWPQVWSRKNPQCHGAMDIHGPCSVQRNGQPMVNTEC